MPPATISKIKGKSGYGVKDVDDAVSNSFASGANIAKELHVAEDAAPALGGEAAPKASGFDKAESRMNLLWNVPFAGFVGTGVYKLGRKMGAVGKPLMALGKGLGFTNEALETHNVGDLKHTLSSTTRYVGEKTNSSSLTDAAAKMVQTEASASAAVTEFSTKALSGLGGHLENQVQKTSWLNKWRNKRVQNALKEQAESMEAAGKAHVTSLESLETLKGKLQGKPEFSKALEVIGAAQKDMKEMPAAIDGKSLGLRTKVLAEHENALHQALNDIKVAAKSRLKEVKQAAGAKAPVLAGATSNAGKLEITASTKEYNAIKSTIKSTKKQFGGFVGSVGGVHTQLGNAEAKGITAGLGNLKSGLAAIPEHLSKMNGTEALNSGLYVAQQGFTGVRGARSLGGSIGAFKEMNADAQGVDAKHVSTLKTLAQLAYIAKVPSELKEARSQFWMSAGPRALATAGGMFAFSKAMSRSAGMKTQMIGFMLQQGAETLGNKVASYNAELETYHAAHDEFKKHKHLDAGIYAALAIQAHKADNLEIGDPRLVIVSKQYEQENLSPDGMLKEIASGKFKERLAAAKQEVDAAAKAKPADAKLPVAEAHNTMPGAMSIAPEAVTVPSDNEIPASALSRLANKGTLAPDQVVGKHTGKEASRRDMSAASELASPVPH